MEYQFKTEPFAHQRREFEEHKDDLVRALWWEMGTMKSSAVLNNAAYLYESGKIDALVVVAPNGVAENWVTDEVPKHLPDRVAAVTRCITWSSAKAHKKPWVDAAREARLEAKFLILAHTYHGIMTELGDALLVTVLKKRRCMLVLDESARIKDPGTMWTRKLRKLAPLANYRRALTGTPVADNPFDAYSQVCFLNPAAFAHLGVRTSAAYKAYFATWGKGFGAGGREFPRCLGYRNLPVLREVLESYGRRILKTEVLDLPPQVYSKRYFDMSDRQWRIYEDLKKDWESQLTTGTVTTALAIVRLTRFQQLTSGFVTDDDGVERAVGDPNPRIELLRDVINDVGGQFILWGKFRRDIDSMEAALQADGITYARYDGMTNEHNRLAARRAFQAGEVRCFLANPAAAGEGLTLTAATTVIYYNVGYKLSERLQSESRAHRQGQTNSVLYIDLIASNTVDEKIVDALRSKRDVASTVTGDVLKSWI